MNILNTHPPTSRHNLTFTPSIFRRSSEQTEHSRPRGHDGDASTFPPFAPQCLRRSWTYLSIECEPKVHLFGNHASAQVLPEGQRGRQMGVAEPERGRSYLSVDSGQNTMSC